MTAKEICDDARVLLSDPENPGGGLQPTWSQAQLRAWINETGRLILQMFAETRIDESGRLRIWQDVTSDSSVVSLPDNFKPAFVDAVVARAYEQDSSDKRDRELAKYHYQRFVAFFRR